LKIDTFVYTMIQSVSMDRKNLTRKDREAIRHIRNCLVHHGRSPSVRELMRALDYNSPRSAALVLDRLMAAGTLMRRPDGTLRILKDPTDAVTNPQTVEVPLVGSVACGTPIFAQENIEAMIPISNRFVRSGSRYFLLKTLGDSMDEAGIDDGDLVLVRQQSTARNGDLVVALIDDNATVKEFHHSGTTIILKPKSRNKKHQAIILTQDFLVQGIVTRIIKNFQ
jgi:repressor LexA